MTFYISGPISKNKNFMEDFERARKRLRNLGVSVLNPVDYALLDPGKSWEHYMRHDLCSLAMADGIYMLKGWRRSKGARLEYKIAKALKLEILYE